MTRQSHLIPSHGSPRLRAGMGLAAAGLAVGLAVTAAATGVAGSRPAAGSGARRSPASARARAAVPLAPGHEIDGWVAAAEQAVAQHPKDAAAFRGLAVAFMRKQRQCGDPGYYRRAMAAIDRSLKLEPDSYESLKLEAWVLAGQHRFTEARDLGRQCVARQPKDPWNYGSLVDAQAELGDYPAAVAAAQEMIDLKPDLASYSRAAHLRDLHGDPEGALQLYDLALDTTSARDPESVAWVRVQRGNVRMSTGAARAADAEYQKALEAQPGYHLALAGRARCQAALGHRQAAIRLYEQALIVVPRPDWAMALGDLQQAAGDPAGAEAQYALARAAMAANGTSVDTDRQMALLLADHGDPKRALQHARRAAQARDDIYTCDALAWTLFKNGRYQKAWRASQRARRLGTRDATLLRHAALIAARVPGASREAARLLRQARALDPTIDKRRA